MPDRRLLVGGQGIVRLNADGSDDSSFVPPQLNGSVRALARQRDGKLIIAGDFRLPGDARILGAIRLLPEGSFDSDFKPIPAPRVAFWPIYSGFHSVAIQADGKILLGGEGPYGTWDAFTPPTEPLLRGITRWLPNGDLDETFLAATNVGYRAGIRSMHGEGFSHVSVVQLTAENLILAAGAFSIFNGAAMGPLVRLDSRGALDPTFQSRLEGGVRGLVLQPDGAVLVTGRLLKINEGPGEGLARLRPDGNLEASFRPDIIGSIAKTALQSDGKIIVAGAFTTINGFPVSGLARLNSDGSLDTGFNAGLAPQFDWFRDSTALLILRDGSILVGGAFTSFNGKACPSLVRLIGGEPTPGPPIITVVPPDQTHMAGTNVALSFQALSPGPPRFQWFHDGNVLQGTTNPVLTIPNALPIHTGAYSVAVSNSSGSVTSPPVKLTIEPIVQTPGAVDPRFFAGSGPDGAVLALAATNKGDLLVGGDFSFFDGQPRSRLARLSADGKLDPQFGNALGIEGSVTLISPQANGQIVIGGSFTNVGPARCERLARLNADGSLDATFVNPLPRGNRLRMQPLALQADNKLLVLTTNGLERVNPDGVIDATFDARDSVGRYPAIRSAVLQSDGKILLCGFGPPDSSTITRLHGDGSRDRSFEFGPAMRGLGPVTAVGVGEEDAIFFAAYPQTFGQARCDGQIVWTESLPLAGETGAIFALALQLDGTLVLGGRFNIFRFCRTNLVRLFGPNQKALPPMFTTQPQDTTLRAGQSLALSVTAQNLDCLRFQWQFNGAAIPGATNRWFHFPDIRPEHSGNYSVEAINPMGVVRSTAAKVTVAPPETTPGATDLSLYPQARSVHTIFGMSRGADGSFYLVGKRTSSAGDRVAWTRLKPDGSQDTEFAPPARMDALSAFADLGIIAAQPDGKVLFASRYFGVNGWPGALFRVLPDGSLDTGFNPGTGPEPLPQCCSMLNALLPRPDGTILVGGNFDLFSAGSHVGLVRLRPDGRIDDSFTLAPSLNAAPAPGDPFPRTSVEALAEGDSGTVFVAGRFHGLGGLSRHHVARLLPDDRVDPSFVPELAEGGYGIRTVIQQPDGRCLISGSFYFPGETVFARTLARLLSNGNVDRSFKAGIYSAQLLALQRSGGILVTAGTNVFRLFADGAVDQSFRASFSSGQVLAAEVEPNEDIVVAGTFELVNGIERPGLVRLHGQATYNLRLMSPGIENGMFVLYALPEAGQRIALESTDVIAGGNWQTVTNVLGDGTLKALQDPAPVAAQRYYRLLFP